MKLSAANMRCAVCHWEPPMLRVRDGIAKPASDRWRWRELVEHIMEQTDVEEADGRADGPHSRLEEQFWTIRNEDEQ